MEWLVGGQDRDSGILQLDDGTLLAKEYRGNGVSRTWKILKCPNCENKKESKDNFDE